MQQWETEVKCSPTLSLRYGQWYSLRLFLSRHGELLHLPDLLYGVDEVDARASGQKQFDYVDPRNREALYGSSQKNRGVAAAEDPDGCG